MRNISEFNHGLVLSAEPLQDDVLFEVRIDEKVLIFHLWENCYWILCVATFAYFSGGIIDPCLERKHRDWCDYGQSGSDGTTTVCNEAA